MKLTFNKYYSAIAVVLFITEVIIALFVRDKFIRPYFGDVLVVILIYCLVKSVLDLPVIPLAIGVLIFAFAIEFLQYLKIIDMLGWGDFELAKIVIGNSFAWADLIAYVAGIGIVLLVERFGGQKPLLSNTKLTKYVI